ncbi:anthranilate phosphoribosyltransferase [Gilvibacter sp. SZ-19]|jgi:anthranilate phosphoribosyltransferase|uniref:anthranilate phosphoribosyltransferase n=1 Tax=unclassified Gilvibacter TaxID=2625242 RepID=UPI000B3C1B64|nr:anthranilate phosphoribosyltransferase [Gilvibacter sp. SZ-19]ARV11262.1 anthranilate phosphoribosyltransferase [Gilvibacter sp. SZ-19]
MKAVLNRLINQEILSKEEARDILINISAGQYNEAQIAAFLTVYMMRSITVDELQGFRDALLELCIAVPVEDYNTIDLCGTGGDGKNTFNISTLASFVTAASGVQVTKHGNYGVSSVSGSSNVMEHMGVKFTNDTDILKRCLDEANICVLHAPLFHPAMKNVGGIRKALGVKTFFNMLGPMVNPAFPKNQLVGVFNLELARVYGYLYQQSAKNYTILHALDGYDEISLTGATRVISNRFEQQLTPEDFGVNSITAEDIFGGDTVEEAASIFKTVLSGQGTDAQNHVVAANAGMAIATVKGCTPKQGFEKALETLKSGMAEKHLNQLVALTNA